MRKPKALCRVVSLGIKEIKDWKLKIKDWCFQASNLILNP
jgi:hypothetical protein